MSVANNLSYGGLAHCEYESTSSSNCAPTQFVLARQALPTTTANKKSPKIGLYFFGRTVL